MSLFGGDSSAPPTDSEYDSASDNPVTADDEAPTRSPPSAQISHGGLDVHVPVEDVDQHLAGNDADSEGSDDEEPARRNRFKGPPQTWKGYTAADRQIAESLQQLEDTDLAAHLYNAHALKRRVRKPASALSTIKNWQSKDVWLKQGRDLQYTDAAGEVQTELVPAKDWTAWPVPPASLYTLSHGLRRAAVPAEKDEWVIGGSGPQDPGEELREEMLGLFLRLAKENWNAKEYQEDSLEGATQKAPSRSRSRSQSAHTDADMKDASGTELGQGDDEKAPGKPRGRKPKVELHIKPAILADDATAQRILRPTIASMLTKLDDVALALQRTRLNHFGRGGLGDSSQSEFTTDAETTEPSDHSRSQSRASRRKPQTRQASSSRASRAPKSPQKQHSTTTHSQDSDSASDYAAHLPLASSAADSDPSFPPTQRLRSTSASTTADDVASTRDRSRAGLMDWSEVLGLAGVLGWNTNALSRTAARCSSLFGEKMALQPLAEHTTTTPSTTTTTTTPFPQLSVHNAPAPTAKRPYFQTGALRCPHADCYGHAQDFQLAYRVIEHCVRVHGYDPRTNDSDNEERTVGGVHVDGFLRPVTGKRGWLGRGRVKAGKRRRVEGGEGGSGEGV